MTVDELRKILSGLPGYAEIVAEHPDAGHGYTIRRVDLMSRDRSGDEAVYILVTSPDE